MTLRNGAFPSRNGSGDSKGKHVCLAACTGVRVCAGACAGVRTCPPAILLLRHPVPLVRCRVCFSGYSPWGGAPSEWEPSLLLTPQPLRSRLRACSPSLHRTRQTPPVPQTQTLCQGPMKLKVVFSPGFGGICSTDASFLQPFHEDAPARSGLHTSGPCSSHSVCLEPLCSEVELPLGVSESHVTQRARGPGWCC